MENRSGLAVGGCIIPASGYAERAAALELLGALDPRGRVTLGADKGYETRDFIAAARLLGVTPTKGLFFASYGPMKPSSKGVSACAPTSE